MGRKRACETESRRRKQKGEGGRDRAPRQRKMNNINGVMVKRLRRSRRKKIKQQYRERENKFFPELRDQSMSAGLISF